MDDELRRFIGQPFLVMPAANPGVGLLKFGRDRVDAAALEGEYADTIDILTLAPKV